MWLASPGLHSADELQHKAKPVVGYPIVASQVHTLQKDFTYFFLLLYWPSKQIYKAFKV